MLFRSRLHGILAAGCENKGERIPVERAARIPGAAVLRAPQPGAIGHIVIADGRGGTVEAHSSKRGVIASTLTNRRWDMGILVPGIRYKERAAVEIVQPQTVIFRLMKPRMTGPKVKGIQRRLKELGFHPGPIDGQFGPMTHAAVVAFQVARGLLADGEVGPRTARALGPPRRAGSSML